MLIPFISFFVSPDTYIFNNLFTDIFNFFDITSQKNILTTVSISFILIVLLSGFIRIKYIRYSNLLTENFTSDFRIKLFNFLVNQDFSYYFKKGSNELMSNLAQKSVLFSVIIFSTLNIINSVLITIAIISVLIFNEPVFTTIIVISILLFFVIIFKIKSRAVLNKGQDINLNQNLLVNIIHNAIGYLPEVIIYNLRNFFLNNLSNVSNVLAKSAAQIRTISTTPRIYLETSVIVFAVIAIYFIDFGERSIEANISYLAILAYGAQKCLPLINTIYTLSISFKSSIPGVDGYLKILEEKKLNIIEDKEYKNFKFEKTIEVKNLSYKYNKDQPFILNKINFNITKGQKIAIKGKTGSGKTTLINIIAGLIKPTGGEVFIDDTLLNIENIKRWQKNISFVPQTIFLNDATVSENIAIGVDINSIDIEKVKKSAEIAQISSFIESLPSKYNETVGERGVRLSGGQRQRIGIARALYRNTSLIILDEPTNALDFKTEAHVMNAITKLDKNTTLIMISHSDESLKHFNKIIDLDKFQ
tara:strand:- start:238 stop:1833 length:1596 start_codon:yes stop_codon:yes gene_type:complete